MVNLKDFLNSKVMLFVLVMEAFLAYALQKQQEKNLMFLMIQYLKSIGFNPEFHV